MRFIDEYKEYKPKVGSIYDDFIVVDGQGVLEYYLNNYLEDTAQGFKEPIDMIPKELPKMAPPFDKMFIDFTLPHNFYHVRELRDVYPKEFGVAVKFIEDKKFMEDVFKDLVGKENPEYLDSGIIPKVVDEAKWILCGTVIFKTSYKNSMYIEPFHRFVVFIDPDGKIIEFPSKDKDSKYNSFLLLSPSFSVDSLIKNFSKRDSKEETDNWYLPHQNFSHICINTALLTITFMHCKNLIRTITEPNKKEARRRERHHKTPLVKYYTLTIQPNRKSSKSYSQGLDGEGNIPLHICRGHFKDFGEKGLFGKYKGLYWWDMHMRGHKKNGTIIKDYKVEAPESEV